MIHVLVRAQHEPPLARVLVCLQKLVYYMGNSGDSSNWCTAVLKVYVIEDAAVTPPHPNSELALAFQTYEGVSLLYNSPHTSLTALTVTSS
jgi:hypothetical protein